jgi:hypothetical protein
MLWTYIEDGLDAFYLRSLASWGWVPRQRITRAILAWVVSQEKVLVHSRQNPGYDSMITYQILSNYTFLDIGSYNDIINAWIFPWLITSIKQEDIYFALASFTYLDSASIVIDILTELITQLENERPFYQPQAFIDLQSLNIDGVTYNFLEALDNLQLLSAQTAVKTVRDQITNILRFARIRGVFIPLDIPRYRQLLRVIQESATDLEVKSVLPIIDSPELGPAFVELALSFIYIHGGYFIIILFGRIRGDPTEVIREDVKTELALLLDFYGADGGLAVFNESTFQLVDDYVTFSQN